MTTDWLKLKTKLNGDLYTDSLHQLLYATDASAYRELPKAVVFPKDKEDIKLLILFAAEHQLTLIPRAAGTSLAGQLVGSGIVVDVSKYMTRILEVNVEESWVWLEPGVVLDELNQYLEPMGLFFAPETSTANRCMIGGMLGNNACGLHSLIYGSTRDHTLAVQTVLSDASEALFEAIDRQSFDNKCKQDNLEGRIYNTTREILSDPYNQQQIREEYPDPAVKRRNTGYALDILLDSEPLTTGAKAFNMSNLLAGSEGTLAFTTAIKLNLIPCPPKEKAVIAVHVETLSDAFMANLIALEYNPGAVELMDKIVLDCTKDNREQQKNRFFVKGDPAAILIVEFARDTRQEIEDLAKNMEQAMRSEGYGYHFPVLWGSDIKRVWNLRKAGLGVLSNMVGDAKPVSVIEDTAVKPEVLPEYLKEFNKILDKYNKTCVYYAHIGTGELHLRPVLNLKYKHDVELFHTIALETAHLVKRYKGSLSGEHGDGRLRGEFIPLMLGEHNYKLLKKLKAAWDPDNLFNPEKIVDTPKMNTSLRYVPGQETRAIDTVFDFSESGGILRAAERCNGSGDCRKSEKIGGTMCPSFMATRDETNLTRARANVLREMLTNSTKLNPFDHREIYEVMDMCLSCKACKSECPSSVDIAKLKAEFLQHYYDANGIPLRSRLIAYFPRVNRLGAVMPRLTNFFMRNSFTSGLMKRFLGFAAERNLPLLSDQTLNKWFTKKHTKNKKSSDNQLKKLYLFNDETLNYNDTEIGIKAILLLTKLGYEVVIPKHIESGRTYLSKGLLRTAKRIANKNIAYLKDFITEETPLIGIEPSSILSFRDEYPDLADSELKADAAHLAQHSLLFDEFLAREMKAGVIKREQFTEATCSILLHGHCQQKAIASTLPTKEMLAFPINYTVEEIPSGCCGMAGAFGYEKEHYELSMKVGELVLFPAVRAADSDTLIVAPGTSCRHQIKDGTGRDAKHPVEVLYEALL